MPLGACLYPGTAQNSRISSTLPLFKAHLALERLDAERISQEKFPNSHFGFKKGNTWDLKGILLGKPKIGKVLPKPFMDQENPILIPTMGFFAPILIQEWVYFVPFSPVLGLNIPIVIPIMGFFRPNFYSGMGFFCTIFSPVLGLNFPILIPTMGFFCPNFYPRLGLLCTIFTPVLGLTIPIPIPTMGLFCPKFYPKCFLLYHVFPSIGIQHFHSNPNNGICCPNFHPMFLLC